MLDINTINWWLVAVFHHRQQSIVVIHEWCKIGLTVYHLVHRIFRILLYGSWIWLWNHGLMLCRGTNRFCNSTCRTNQWNQLGCFNLSANVNCSYTVRNSLTQSIFLQNVRFKFVQCIFFYVPIAMLNNIHLRRDCHGTNEIAWFYFFAFGHRRRQ